MRWTRIALLLLIALPATAPAQTGNYSDQSFGRLNTKFRELYAIARTERLIDVSPVVIARGDNLILIRDGQRYVGPTVHPNYHDLKAVAHVPLGIFCVLSSHVDTELEESVRDRVRGFRKHIAEVLVATPKSFDDTAVRDRQTSMLRQCVEFTDEVVEKGACKSGDLDSLIDQLRPFVLQNVEAATRLRIDNYHQQMQAWRKLFSDAEWSRLYVVIPGAALPRKSSTAVQYFAKLLQEPGEGRRIIYAESQFDESQDLLLLGTHILDAQVGVAFFSDPWRMQRDLLASAADSYLDTLDFDDMRKKETK